MNSITRAFLAAGCAASLFTSCDRKSDTADNKPAPAPAPAVAENKTPAPPPGDQPFSHPDANEYLASLKEFPEKIKEALKTADMEQIQPLIDKGKELLTKAEEWATKLKPEESSPFRDKVAEIGKKIAEVSDQNNPLWEAAKVKIAEAAAKVAKTEEKPAEKTEEEMKKEEAKKEEAKKVEPKKEEEGGSQFIVDKALTDPKAQGTPGRKADPPPPPGPLQPGGTGAPTIPTGPNPVPASGRDD